MARSREILERDSGEVPDSLVAEQSGGESLLRGTPTDKQIQLAKTLLVMGYSRRQVAVMVMQKFASQHLTEHSAKRVVAAAGGLLQRLCNKPPALIAGEAMETYYFVIRSAWQEITAQTEVIRHLDDRLRRCNEDLEDLNAGRPLRNRHTDHRSATTALMRGTNTKAVIAEEKDDIQADIRQALQRKAMAIKQLMDCRKEITNLFGTPSRQSADFQNQNQNSLAGSAGGGSSGATSSRKNKQLSGDENPATVDEAFQQLEGLLAKVASRVAETEE